MIILAVEDYCHDCLDFLVDANTIIAYADNQVAHLDNVVSCKHRNKCKNLLKHLGKEGIKIND